MTYSGPSNVIMRQSAKNMKLGSSSALFFRYAEVLLFINCFHTFEDTSVKIVVLVLELKMCYHYSWRSWYPIWLASNGLTKDMNNYWIYIYIG